MDDPVARVHIWLKHFDCNVARRRQQTTFFFQFYFFYPFSSKPFSLPFMPFQMKLEPSRGAHNEFLTFYFYLLQNSLEGELF